MNRIIVATPTDGSPLTAHVTWGYHNSIRSLERLGATVIDAHFSFSDDLARARSRAVRQALKHEGWEWMLWIDDDVVFNAAIVPVMLERAARGGYEMIGAPYPRKRIPAKFPYKPMSSELARGELFVKDDCVMVELLAFGFVLTSRAMLETMCDHYAATEWFTDTNEDGGAPETVALFRQVMTEERTMAQGDKTMRYRELYSEDYSFCHRWRAIGGEIAMYVGPGAPLGHVGGHMFVGMPDEIGNVR